MGIGLVARSAPLLVIACAATLGFSAPRRAARPVARARSASTSPARTVYLRDCAVCHGADARGTGSGPTLQGVGRAALDYWLTTGRMPLVANARPAKSPQGEAPAGQRLADPDAEPRRGPPAYSATAIQALEAYVLTLAPGGPDVPSTDVAAADLAVGGQVFREQCAACHAWSGVGGALYQRAAPDLAAATPAQIAEAVRIGPDQMPSFGSAAVPDAQLNDVVGYVRYLDHPDNRGGNPLWHIGPVAEGAIALIIGLGALLLCARFIGERE
jgi:ubiquinol-cytochrome c reductase cytochrome c subunit